MNIIDISYENINNYFDNEILVKTCNNILKLLEIDNWEISIVFSDNDFIRKLNKDYRSRDEATDVLSFPQRGGEEVPQCVNSAEHITENNQQSSFYAGDIVISLDTVEKNSNYFNVDKNEELIRLLIHGILHLSGMEHESNEPDQEMLIKQEDILKSITGVNIF